MTGTTARLATSSDKAAWNAFVDKSSEGTFFHDWRWIECVEVAYGYRNVSLVAERDGVVVGVLPLTLVKSPLLGRSVVSTAFSVGGGIAATDAAAATALATKAIEIGRDSKAKYVELRGGRAPECQGWTEKTGVYECFERELPKAADDMQKWLPRSRRFEVKRARRIVEEGKARLNLSTDVDQFYDVYAEALKFLGTPVMPRKFLRLLKESFGDAVEVSLIESKNENVAGLISFLWKDRLLPYYIGGTVEARNVRAYDFLYYSAAVRAIERGVRIFDFGRSKTGSTHADTKQHWGFEPQPSTYYVALIAAKELPNVNPNNPKFARFVAIWKKLPLPVANFFGPILARNFP